MPWWRPRLNLWSRRHICRAKQTIIQAHRVWDCRTTEKKCTSVNSTSAKSSQASWISPSRRHPVQLASSPAKRHVAFSYSPRQLHCKTIWRTGEVKWSDARRRRTPVWLALVGTLPRLQSCEENNEQTYSRVRLSAVLSRCWLWNG